MTPTQSRSQRRSVSSFSRIGIRAGLTLIAVLLIAQPSAAAWDGETIEKNSAKGVDAVLVRPIATLRVIVGAVLFVPASLFASPSGREGIEGAYDVLIASPMEYAFDRKLGEF